MPIPPIPPDGSLITGSTAPQVYRIENQQRRWVPDPMTFEALGFRWEDIQQFTDVEVNYVPLGTPLPHTNRIQAQVDTFLGAGHYMTTGATLLSNGLLTANTRTRTVTWFGGFTGGVHVLLADVNDVVIGASTQHTFGVDGTWVGRSDRNDPWTENIDPALTGRTTRLGIIHAWAPKVDTEEMVRRAIRIGTIIWALIEEANQEDGSGGGTA